MDEMQRENLIQKMYTFYEAQNDLGPQYLSDMFTPVSEIHGSNTRSAANSDLYVPTR